MSRNIHIHNIVSHFPSTLIDLLQNIQIVLRKHLRNVSEHTRRVLSHDRESNRIFGSRGERRGGEVYRVADGSRFEEVTYGLGGHGGGGVFCLAGGGAEVGKDDGVFVVPEDIVGEVGDVPSIVSVQMILQCLAVDQLAPGKVEQYSPALEVLHDRLTNDTMRATLSLDVWNIDRNVIRISDRIRNAIRQINRTRKLERIFNRKSWIVTHHFHAQMFCIPRCARTDVTQPNHRQRLTLDLPPAKEGLVLLHPLLRQTLLPEGSHVVNSIHDAAGSQQHARQHQLLHRVGIRAGGVEHGNAQLGHARHGDVIRTGAASGDGADRVGHLGFLELVTAEQNGVCVGRRFAFFDLVLRLGEFL
mmetsp:Transcript_39242/g.82060  ORF Transcript_39242/g.82060 Transcript_39242/m.82060 type:complete len:359 (+) Transcript_39242:257-1333(+)